MYKAPGGDRGVPGMIVNVPWLPQVVFETKDWRDELALCVFINPSVLKAEQYEMSSHMVISVGTENVPPVGVW